MIILPSTKSYLPARSGEIAGSVKAESRTPQLKRADACWLERRRGVFLHGLIEIDCDMVAWRRSRSSRQQDFIGRHPEHRPFSDRRPK